MTECGWCPSVGPNESYSQTCTYKVAVGSLVIFLISAVALAIIVALSQAAPEAFATVGGDPTLWCVTAWTGAWFVALILSYIFLRCRNSSTTEPTSRQNESPQPYSGSSTNPFNSVGYPSTYPYDYSPQPTVFAPPQISQSLPTSGGSGTPLTPAPYYPSGFPPASTTDPSEKERARIAPLVQGIRDVRNQQQSAVSMLLRTTPTPAPAVSTSNNYVPFVPTGQAFTPSSTPYHPATNTPSALSGAPLAPAQPTTNLPTHLIDTRTTQPTVPASAPAKPTTTVQSTSPAQPSLTSNHPPAPTTPPPSGARPLIHPATPLPTKPTPSMKASGAPKPAPTSPSTPTTPTSAGPISSTPPTVIKRSIQPKGEVEKKDQPKTTPPPSKPAPSPISAPPPQPKKETPMLKYQGEPEVSKEWFDEKCSETDKETIDKYKRKLQNTETVLFKFEIQKEAIYCLMYNNGTEISTRFSTRMDYLNTYLADAAWVERYFHYNEEWINEQMDEKSRGELAKIQKGLKPNELYFRTVKIFKGTKSVFCLLCKDESDTDRIIYFQTDAARAYYCENKTVGYLHRHNFDKELKEIPKRYILDSMSDLEGYYLLTQVNAEVEGSKNKPYVLYQEGAGPTTSFDKKELEAKIPHGSKNLAEVANPGQERYPDEIGQQLFSKQFPGKAPQDLAQNALHKEYVHLPPQTCLKDTVYKDFHVLITCEERQPLQVEYLQGAKNADARKLALKRHGFRDAKERHEADVSFAKRARQAIVDTKKPDADMPFLITYPDSSQALVVETDGTAKYVDSTTLNRDGYWTIADWNIIKDLTPTEQKELRDTLGQKFSSNLDPSVQGLIDGKHDCKALYFPNERVYGLKSKEFPNRLLFFKTQEALEEQIRKDALLSSNYPFLKAVLKEKGTYWEEEIEVPELGETIIGVYSLKINDETQEYEVDPQYFADRGEDYKKYIDGHDLEPEKDRKKAMEGPEPYPVDIQDALMVAFASKVPQRGGSFSRGNSLFKTVPFSPFCRNENSTSTRVTLVRSCSDRCFKTEEDARAYWLSQSVRTEDAAAWSAEAGGFWAKPQKGTPSLSGLGWKAMKIAKDEVWVFKKEGQDCEYFKKEPDLMHAIRQYTIDQYDREFFNSILDKPGTYWQETLKMTDPKGEMQVVYHKDPKEGIVATYFLEDEEEKLKDYLNNLGTNRREERKDGHYPEDISQILFAKYEKEIQESKTPVFKTSSSPLHNQDKKAFQQFFFLRAYPKVCFDSEQAALAYWESLPWDDTPEEHARILRKAQAQFASMPKTIELGKCQVVYFEEDLVFVSKTGPETYKCFKTKEALNHHLRKQAAKQTKDEYFLSELLNDEKKCWRTTLTYSYLKQYNSKVITSVHSHTEERQKAQKLTRDVDVVFYRNDKGKIKARYCDSPDESEAKTFMKEKGMVNVQRALSIPNSSAIKMLAEIACPLGYLNEVTSTLYCGEYAFLTPSKEKDLKAFKDGQFVLFRVQDGSLSLEYFDKKFSLGANVRPGFVDQSKRHERQENFAKNAFQAAAEKKVANPVFKYEDPSGIVFVVELGKSPQYMTQEEAQKVEGINAFDVWQNLTYPVAGETDQMKNITGSLQRNLEREKKVGSEVKNPLYLPKGSYAWFHYKTEGFFCLFKWEKDRKTWKLEPSFHKTYEKLESHFPEGKKMREYTPEEVSLY